MNTTLLNNHTKFGAKIFRRYQVITFYVLGHFLAAPCISSIHRCIQVSIDDLCIYDDGFIHVQLV